MPIRILIADDHAIIRTGLRMLLEKEGEFAVVGEAASGPETLSLVEETRPDVLILDLSLPELSGIGIAEQVVVRHPEVGIVILTMHEDEHYLRELLRIGAGGFVLKKSPGAALVQAIQAVRRGDRYVDPSLAGKLLAVQAGADPGVRKPGTLDSVTPREREVLRLLAHGHTGREVAAKLGISERTVDTHRTNVLGKLGLKSRAEMVRFALDHGLLSLE